MLSSFYTDEFWLFRLAFILFGYCTVTVPVGLLVVFIRRKYRDGTFEPTNFWRRFLMNFALGHPEYDLVASDSSKQTSNTVHKNLLDGCCHLFFCFAGLQVTLVSMGYFQERIMTQEYRSEEQLNKFGNTQFLVFMNRVFAIFLSGFYLIYHWKREPLHVPPLYKHAYTSVSNTLSSWCQYEALKYVSFPAQTVCKASKILPTMLMGFIVRGEKYNRGDCACAVLLAFGASLFLLENSAKMWENGDRVTTFSGVCLMLGYLSFDAFTLNWQKSLFDTRPRVSKHQMMFVVNVFSMILCFVALVERGDFFSSIDFLLTYDGFAIDVFLLSLSGALGQIAIYETVERFGPVIFAVMMTLRQIFSIALSTIAYNHPLTIWSACGLVVAFSAIFANIYRKRYAKIGR